MLSPFRELSQDTNGVTVVFYRRANWCFVRFYWSKSMVETVRVSDIRIYKRAQEFARKSMERSMQKGNFGATLGAALTCAAILEGTGK